jgi:ATP-dependent DNA helicase RecQ
MRGRLEAMIGLTETCDCRTRLLLECFGEHLPGDCGHCDNCVSPTGQFDGTTEAQKLLSAIYRTGQRFGGLHVISVLMGKPSDMASKFGHDRLSVFGIGAERSRDFWRGVLRQLVARGILEVDIGEFATISLVADKARPILKGEERVMLRDDIVTAKPRRAKDARPVSTHAATSATPESASLFEALRTWRGREAKAQGVPPYVIFHDTVLREIAAVRPASEDELGQIKGVGASKLARYAAGVLDILRVRDGL